METGVAEIDTQHKQLVDLLNGLNYAMKRGEGTRMLGQLLHGLGNYILLHFSLEERYMKATQYPKLEQHRAEHLKFARRILEFDRGFKQGNVLLTVEVTRYLRDWVHEHIAGCDQDLGRHLQLFRKR